MNKKALAAFGGLAAFGILTASAASLGGLTSSSLGADQTVIASCDTAGGVSMSYTTVYDPTTNAYKTSGVVTGLVDAACIGKTFKLSLSDGAASLGEYTGSITAASQTIPVTPNVDAKSITKAALVITG